MLLATGGQPDRSAPYRGVTSVRVKGRQDKENQCAFVIVDDYIQSRGRR